MRGVPCIIDRISAELVRGRLALRRWLPVLLALLTGGAGGALFAWFNLPLAWMIGAMVTTTAATMAGGTLTIPGPLRNSMAMVLGIMLGSAFSPALLGHLVTWSVSLSGLALYLILATLVGLLFLRRVAGYDPVTAYFTATPGGFNEMVLVGSALGGDGRTIALVHAMRIMLVVMTVPVWFRLLDGYAPGARGALGPALSDLSAVDGLLLALCALGAPLALRLRMPAAILLGPMLLSAAIHLAGFTTSTPPGALVAVAQVVLGAGIGCRFNGVALGTIVRTAGTALGVTVCLTGMTLAAAFSLHTATGIGLAALILAYAPGGLAEMSLVALALHVDTAFVATHHTLRIVLVILLAPALFRLWRWWRRDR